MHNTSTNKQLVFKMITLSALVTVAILGSVKHLGLMADTAYQCLQTRDAQQVGTKATEATTLKTTAAQTTVVIGSTAGFRTTKNYAKISVGDFAAKRTRIILPLEKLGPKDLTVFLNMVVHVLAALIKVRNALENFLYIHKNMKI